MQIQLIDDWVFKNITIIQENAFKQKKENWDKNSTLG